MQKNIIGKMQKTHNQRKAKCKKQIIGKWQNAKKKHNRQKA